MCIGTFIQLFWIFRFVPFGHYGRNLTSSTNLQNIFKTPSPMKRLHNYNFEVLQRGFGKPFVAICRRPLLLDSQTLHNTFTVCRGPLRREPQIKS